MDPAFGSALGLSHAYDHWTDGKIEEQRGYDKEVAKFK